MESVAVAPLSKEETEKHPKEMFRVAFTTMWDMFSFYGMKALLIAYIVTQLRLGQPMGYAILGTYAALVFGFNFFGGMVADKFLGTRKAIIWGGYLQITGHLILAIPSELPFFTGLALVATGAGFRNGTSGSFVGSFYNNNNPRKKDDGYAIYYMIFNMGAALGGLICGYLGQNINWHLGFGAACIFMIIGQAQFISGINYTHGAPPDLKKLKQKIFLKLFDREIIIYFLSLVVVALVTLLLQFPGFMNIIMLPLTIVAFIYIIIVSFKFSMQERWRLFAAMTICLITSLFWAFYEQIGGSLSLFSLHNVNLNVGGSKLSGLSINSFTPSAWLVVLTPISIRTWKWLDTKKANPRSYIKLVLSFMFMSFCFLLLWFGSFLNKDTGMLPVSYLIAAYLLMEMGEICLGPVVYSLVSKLSPKEIASTLMGIMFLSVSLGEYLSGKLGAFMTVPENISKPIEMMPYFSSIFLKIGIGSLLISLLIILLIPVLRKWMQEVR
jgi:amino acid/peptide transporter (Peptide:H+ symporter), bacterial